VPDQPLPSTLSVLPRSWTRLAALLWTTRQNRPLIRTRRTIFTLPTPRPTRKTFLGASSRACCARMPRPCHILAGMGNTHLTGLPRLTMGRRPRQGPPSAHTWLQVYAWPGGAHGPLLPVANAVTSFPLPCLPSCHCCRLYPPDAATRAGRTRADINARAHVLPACLQAGWTLPTILLTSTPVNLYYYQFHLHLTFV